MATLSDATNKTASLLNASSSPNINNITATTTNGTWPVPVFPREYDLSHYYQPHAALICNLLLIIISCAVCCSFICNRMGSLSNWNRLPYIIWLVLIIYIDSIGFVVGSSILQFTYVPNEDPNVCQASIVLCIVAYLSTKLFIYLFLVERAFIIKRSESNPTQSRSQRWYIIHFFAILVINLMFLILLLVYRMHAIKNNLCMISVQHDVLICIIIFDVGINVYLTSLFLLPIIRSYSFQRPSWAQGRRPWNMNKLQRPLEASLHALAVRTLFGTIATLCSSLANLIGQTLFHGQPYWLCLLCCEADILFSAIVIYCITNNKHLKSSTPRSSGNDIERPRETTRSSSKGTASFQTFNSDPIQLPPNAHGITMEP